MVNYSSYWLVRKHVPISLLLNSQLDSIMILTLNKEFIIMNYNKYHRTSYLEQTKNHTVDKGLLEWLKDPLGERFRKTEENNYIMSQIDLRIKVGIEAEIIGIIEDK